MRGGVPRECDEAFGFFMRLRSRSLSGLVYQGTLSSSSRESMEVTAYTSAGQPVEDVVGSGEVYMDFGTAMEISAVTVSAVGSTRECPFKSGQIPQESQPLFRSHSCLRLMCEFGGVLCSARGYLGLQVRRFCRHLSWCLRGFLGKAV